jgi:hypothetical protein
VEKKGDIDKMRERAQRNQTFVYIKIPEVPIRVSYKGNNNKNILDISDFSLILPTIEYHNQTWTWLDVLMAIKNETKHRLLTQAVKQKLHIRPAFLQRDKEKEASSSSSSDDMSRTGQTQEATLEEDKEKARLILGNIAVPSSSGSSSTRRGLSSFFTHRK